RCLPGPKTVVWDQIAIHDCEAVDRFLAQAGNLVIETFPPYAPELNPADGICRYIKYNRLANYTPMDLDELREMVVRELDRLHRHPDLLRSFVRFTGLPLGL